MKGLSVAMGRRPWIALSAVIAVIIAVHLLTLGIDPLLFQDEVQLVDYGRTALNPHTEWAVTWNVQQSIPVLTISYLGSVLQELAYRVGDGAVLGPRISTMLGAVLAAYCCFGWLRARQTSTGLAFLLAVLFLIDPIFSNVYRQGRVDGFAIAAVLAACWALRSAEQRVGAGRSVRSHLFIAGAFTAASPFFWTTAPALFPLIAVEALYILRAQWRHYRSPGAVVWVLWPAGVGLVIAAALLAIPVLADLELYWQGLLSAAAVQARAALIQNNIFDLFLVHDPGLTILVLVSVFMSREIGLVIALVAAIAIIDRTMVYLPRVLYLLPYLLAIVASAYANVSGPRRRRIFRRILNYLLVLGLALNIVWVLVLRPMAAHRAWPANDSAQIRSSLEASIGPGNHRVLLEVWEAYYTGRSLGWAMYQAGSPVATDDYVAFARQMDFAILPKNQSYRTIGRDRLIEAGFVLRDEITLAQAGPMRLPSPLSGFSFPGGGYVSMEVFENTRRSQVP